RDGAVWQLFEEAVQHVARVLALAIVGDGEGASKLVEIQVVGAASEAAARDVGRAIARSTLVKTAIYGADPNWGRILAAAGAAGVALTLDRLTLQAAADGEWLTLAEGGATAPSCCPSWPASPWTNQPPASGPASARAAAPRRSRGRRATPA